VNRKRKLDQYSVHHDMQLYDFISRRRAKTRNMSVSNSKLLKKVCVRFSNIGSLYSYIINSSLICNDVNNLHIYEYVRATLIVDHLMA
jgi:hypothetical protein